MAATNKCNISKLVKAPLNELLWGVVDGSNNDAILENYATYLNCSTYTPDGCIAPDDCSNPTEVVVCDIEVDDIEHTTDGAIQVFSVGGGTIVPPTNPFFGALKTDPINYTPIQQSNVVRNVLQTPWIRARIVVEGFTGSSGILDYNNSIGYRGKQVLVIVPTEGGGAKPYVTTAGRGAYKAGVKAVLKAYPEIGWVVVNNEQGNPSYHSNPTLDDYIHNELLAVREVITELGTDVKLADGGLMDNFVLHIATYRYVDAAYGSAEAGSYAIRQSMSPAMIAYAKDPIANPNPSFDAAILQLNLMLGEGSEIVDYFNIHYYEEPISSVTTAIKPNVLRYQTEYLRAATNKPLMCNECGVRGNEQPLLVTNLFEELVKVGLVHIQLWDGNATSAGVAFTNTNMTIKPNGQAFKNVHTKYSND